MDHKKLMRTLIVDASTYRFTTKPNPTVGAMIVNEEKVLCTGFHTKYGCNHAEVECLNQLDSKNLSAEDKKKLSLLVTLEPCCHHGKTPPCTDEIIKSGIKNVIVGSLDPNPLMSGKGIQVLRDAGINVKTDVLSNEVKKANYSFFFKHKNNRPFICIKIAMSNDGMSHSLNGSSTWITSKKSRDDVQSLRANYDAIVTGGNTVRDDNPRMNARVSYDVNQPRRIVITREKNWDMKMNFFRDNNFEIVNSCQLDEFIKSFQDRDTCSLLIEAGPKLVNSFLDAGLCDQFVIYKSNRDLGQNGVPWFENKNALIKKGFKLKARSYIVSDVKEVYTI